MTATDEVLARLAHLPPDAYRAILAEWDRARLRGGGEVHMVIRVSCSRRETISVAGGREYEWRLTGVVSS